VKSLFFLSLIFSAITANAITSPFKLYKGSYSIRRYTCQDYTCPQLDKNEVTITESSANIGKVIDVDFRIYEEGEDEYWQLGQFSEREDSATYEERGFYRGQLFKIIFIDKSKFILQYSIRKDGEVFDMELELKKN
jgi:hypothetical protein